jgi:hypothetical protein
LIVFTETVISVMLLNILSAAASLPLIVVQHSAAETGDRVLFGLPEGS